MTPGEILDLRKKKVEYDIKTREVAEALGISSAAISRFEKRDVNTLGLNKQREYREYILKREKEYLRGKEREKGQVINSEMISKYKEFIEQYESKEN